MVPGSLPLASAPQRFPSRGGSYFPLSLPSNFLEHLCLCSSFFLFLHHCFWGILNDRMRKRMAENNQANMTMPEMKLELVSVAVSDVDRAKAFYEQSGCLRICVTNIFGSN
jgi:hypothetical protein